MEERIIDTGLTGEKNLQIIKGIFGQLSDGMWENSPRMAPYYDFAKVVMEGDKVLLKINSDNGKMGKDYSHVLRNKFTKKLFYPSKYISNPYFNMSDDAIKKWFGKKIKEIVFEEYGSAITGNWKRDNQQILDFLGNNDITVSQAYFAYDTLMGRTTTNKKYSKVNDIYESIMTSLNNNKIVMQWGASDTPQKQAKRKAIFDKEMPQIVDKINNWFKQQGLKCTVSIIPGRYFSDGYFQNLKFNTNNSSTKGKEWWEWFNLLDHSKIAETKHLFLYNESGHGINVYLKEGWTPTSHRGEIGKSIISFDQYWRNK